MLSKVDENFGEEFINLNSIDKIPQWFVPIVGFVYATGYLIIFRFFNRFGLRDTSGDLFKAKYIYVGLMYLVFAGMPITLICILALARQLKHDKKVTGQSGGSGPLTPTLILFLNLVLLFAVLVIFAPTGFVRTRPHLFPIICLVTFLGPVMQLLAANTLKDGPYQNLANWVAWILGLATVISLDWYSLYGLLGFLYEVFLGGAYSLIFACMIGYLIWRTYERTANRHRREQVLLMLLALCTIVPLYFLSVLSFAARIYPYIPVRNGGGDYSSERPIILCVDEAGKSALPEEVFEGSSKEHLCTRDLMLIEETTTSIFVADPDAAGGPAQWRTGKGPRVIEIRRDKIVSMVYE